MFILCDTSTVLMLLRIAPDMFIDPKYECLTLVEVKNEILRSTKFKNKYAWRLSYKNKLKVIGMTEYDKAEFKLTEQTIDSMLNNYLMNDITGHFFDLSSVDKKIAAYAICEQFNLATEDKSLKQFVHQEFEIEGYGALEVLNHWIRNGVLVIDDRVIDIISEWKILDEPQQTQQSIKEFESITKRKYTGS